MLNDRQLGHSGSRIDRLRVVSLHWGLTFTGVSKYAASLSAIEDFAPVEIRNLCIRNPKWPTDQVVLRALDHLDIFIQSRLDPSWVWRTADAIRQLDPQVLMAHAFNTYFVIEALSRFAGIKTPVLCSFHGKYMGPVANRRMLEPIYNRFSEYFLRRKATAVACVSTYNKIYLMSKGVAEEKITIIPNGLEDLTVSEGARQDIRGQWGIGKNETVIGTASRLVSEKGLSYLVEAFAALSATRSDLRLVIVGIGPAERDLRKRVAERGLGDRVIFTGFRTDVPACLTAFDIFALPSLDESHSIGLLEAMRAGLAIVATDVGGNTESVQNGCEALIVPSADPTSLTSALERLVGDSSLRRKLGNAAHQRFLADFTILRLAEQTAVWIMRSLSACGTTN